MNDAIKTKPKRPVDHEDLTHLTGIEYWFLINPDQVLYIFEKPLQVSWNIYTLQIYII